MRSVSTKSKVSGIAGEGAWQTSSREGRLRRGRCCTPRPSREASRGAQAPRSNTVGQLVVSPGFVETIIRKHENTLVVLLLARSLHSIEYISTSTISTQAKALVL